MIEAKTHAHATGAQRQNDRGAAVLIALLLTMLLAILGAGVLTLANTETLIGASYRHAEEASYGAEAALERVLTDLASVADWSAVLTAPPGNLISTFDDGAGSTRLPDGRVVSLATLTADRQRDSDGRAGAAVYGANNPQWRLFAHAPIQQLLQGSPGSPSLYLVAWVADDGEDGDGDAARDANGRVVLHAEALGGGGARRSVEALIARSGNGVLQLLAWHRAR